VRESIDYALKATAEKFEGKIALHEYQFLSNHYHLLGTDLAGVLPEFMREFNATMSRQLNALRGIRGSNVEKDYNLCVVDMKTGRKALQHAVYILCNAVEAHLVERSFQWLGPNSYSLEYGQEEVVERPKCGLWSDEASHAERSGSRRSKRARYARLIKMPERVTFKLVRPKIYEHLSDAQLRAMIRREVKKREDKLIEQRKRQRRRVVGWKQALRKKYWSVPTNKEEYFTRRPRFSAETQARRLVLIERYQEFLEAYYAAREELVQAFKDAQLRGIKPDIKGIVFPVGTWLLRRLYKVTCGPCPAAA
jgi:hypothetical protein